MTVTELQNRIAKKEKDIQKIEKRISKWATGLRQADIDVVKVFADVTYDSKSFSSYRKDYENYLNTHKDIPESSDWNKGPNIEELYRAYRDLGEQKVTLNKYQNMLNLELNKDNEFENNRIKVIWDFLLNYKEQVAEFIRNNIDVLNEYYEVNTEMCDWHNNNSYKVYNGEMSREEYNRVYDELRAREKELKQAIHPYTSLVAIRNYPSKTRTVDEKKLEEILLKDCKERYFQLVNQVTDIVGIITDATNLKIKAGELNGIIIGNNGKAKVQTFSAGGWNIQCFHYRTKVSKID